MSTINKPGPKAQAEIDAAMEIVHQGQTWMLKGQKHQVVTRNVRLGLIKTWNSTLNRRDSVCAAWLVKNGEMI